MKFNLNSIIGLLFLFILTVVVMRSFNEHSEYRFEVFHLLLFILGIALAKSRIIEINKLIAGVFNISDKKDPNDDKK